MRKLGWIQILLYLLLVPVSLGIAAVFPYGQPSAAEAASMRRIGDAFSWLPAPLQEALRSLLAGDSVFQSPAVTSLLYTSLLGALTLCFLLGVLRVLRMGESIDGSVVRTLFVMACGSALAAAFVYPAFTQDLWYSISWGRMVTAGVNPYYEEVPAWALAGLPFESTDILMTYGPLWGLICGGLSFFAGGSPLAEYVLMKALLLAAWILCLWLVDLAARLQSMRARAIALCLFGWAPLSIFQTVAEGHNDIVMIAFALIWLNLILRTRHLASPFSLVASASIKFVTAPLAALELWHAWRTGWLWRRQYALALLGSAALAFATFALFVRDTAFLQPALSMRDWNFLTPGLAVYHLAAIIGIPLPARVATGLIFAVFAGFLLHRTGRYLLSGQDLDLVSLALAGFSFLLFVTTGHVWPWFLLWLLWLAALRPADSLARFAIAASVVAPFVHLNWLVDLGWDRIRYTTMTFFVLSLLLAIAMSRLPLGETREV